MACSDSGTTLFMCPGDKVIGRSKGLGGCIGFHNGLAIANWLSVNDAVEPILDPGFVRGNNVNEETP